jgi:hypothetical protein
MMGGHDHALTVPVMPPRQAGGGMGWTLSVERTLPMELAFHQAIEANASRKGV